jgi:hypothetical protein
MPRLLYLLTGIATAIPVVWALGWAVWGAGTSPTEYLSLLGSLVLAASAAIGARRVAARMALVGAMAVWSFYLPSIVGVARIRLSDQELNLSVLLWTPSDSPLQIDEPKQVPNFPDMRLSPAAIQQIRDAGIRGRVSTYAANGNYGHGKRGRVILIMQGPVLEAVELKEPDASNIVYIQDRQKWTSFPPGVPTLKRTIRIEPQADDRDQSSVMVELSDGARQGFGVWWPKTNSGNVGK